MIKRLIASLALFLGISLAQNTGNLKTDSLSRQDSLNIESIIGDHWQGIKDTLLHVTPYRDSLDMTMNMKVFVSIKQKKNKPFSLGFHNFWTEFGKRRSIELINKYYNGLSTIDYILVAQDSIKTDTIKDNGIVKDSLTYKKYKDFFQQVYNLDVGLINYYNSNIPSADKKASIKKYWDALKQKVAGSRIKK